MRPFSLGRVRIAWYEGNGTKEGLVNLRYDYGT
jgi:hypothetical protein